MSPRHPQPSMAGTRWALRTRQEHDSVDVGFATLHVWLRLFARLVIGAGRPRGRRRRFLVSVSQARHWLENIRNRRIMRRCIVPTVLVWTAVIAACWTVGQAVGLDLTLAEFGFAAAGGNLVAALLGRSEQASAATD